MYSSMVKLAQGRRGELCGCRCVQAHEAGPNALTEKAVGAGLGSGRAEVTFKGIYFYISEVYIQDFIVLPSFQFIPFPQQQL